MNATTLKNAALKTAAPDPPLTDSESRAGVIGPNAVLQLMSPLRRAAGEAALHDVFNRARVAHWLSQPPLAMVPEQPVLDLFLSVLEELGPEDGARVLTEAGAGTARYIMSNRIPGPVRLLLRALPPRPAGALLLRAIERHAWTFAGSGECRTEHTRRFTLVIRNNPLATPDCPWHQGVLQTMFQSLVSRRCSLHYSNCGTRACTCCRFDIELA